MNRALAADLVQSLKMSVGVSRQNISLALGVSLAFALPIPSERPQSAGMYYARYYVPNVRTFVSEFNERYLIDTSETLAMVEKVFESRVKQVYVYTGPGAQTSSMLDSVNSSLKDFLSGYSLSEEEVSTIVSAAATAVPKVIKAYASIAEGSDPARKA